jgi:hypothetical protein
VIATPVFFTKWGLPLPITLPGITNSIFLGAMSEAVVVAPFDRSRSVEVTAADKFEFIESFIVKLTSFTS